MKKALLATTALVAMTALSAGEASAAEKIKLGLGGYMEFTALGTSVHYDRNGQTLGNARGRVAEGFEIFDDIEVFFTGSTTLDNGITISVQIELEGQTDGDQIDESYMTISGNFGSIILGSENMPNYKMHYVAPTVSRAAVVSWDYDGGAAGRATGFGGGTALAQDDSAFAATEGRFFANDPQHVAYYTPRVAGVQLGIGWAPDNSQVNNYDGPAGTQFRNGLSLGANFVQNVMGTNVALSGGYIEWFEPPANARASCARTDCSDGAPRLWQAGLNLGWGGLTIGGSYSQTNYKYRTTATQSTESWTAEYGVQYKTGPWGFSLGGLHSQAEGLTNGANDRREHELWRIVGAATYDLSPGVVLHANINHDNQDGEQVTSDSSIAWIFAAGILLSF
jgi:hypothetical protein